MLDLLGGCSVNLSEPPPTDDDWYLNLLWIERQKCLLLTHAGTLFSSSGQTFGARISAQSATTWLRPSIPSSALKSLPTDTFSELEPESVRFAKTASRSTLGFMNEMAVELRYFIADAGGLRRSDIDVLNHGLRRTLRNRGEYVRPIELVTRRLTSRT